MRILILLLLVGLFVGGCAAKRVQIPMTNLYVKVPRRAQVRFWSNAVEIDFARQHLAKIYFTFDGKTVASNYIVPSPQGPDQSQPKKPVPVWLPGIPVPVPSSVNQ
jgi:hypothetical protein